MRPLAAAAVIFLMIAGRAWAAPGSAFEKIYQSIKSDPSFKVRLQAIRVLVKQIKAGAPNEEERAFAVLGEAAVKDEEKLVRGLACFALGELADPRGRSALSAASRDPDPFVRAQAEDALKLLVAPAVAAPVVAAPVAVTGSALAFGVVETPGVELAPEVIDVLARVLESEVKAQAGAKFQIAGEGPGHRFGGSIAKLSIETDAAGASRVTVEVRISITTLPENHLRHVMTAKANAATNKSGAAVTRLRDQVLQAAIGRAVKDSLAILSGE